MRLTLLKHPLVLKKNKSIRGHGRGQYENNGLLFLPQDQAPSGPTNLSQTDGASTFNHTPCLLPNSLRPPAPNHELSPGSVLGCSFKAFSQEISPFLAPASTSMQVSWAFQTCVSGTDCSDPTHARLITLIPLVDGGRGTERICTCEKHQVTSLKLNLLFSINCSLSSLL